MVVGALADNGEYLSKYRVPEEDKLKVQIGERHYYNPVKLKQSWKTDVNPKLMVVMNTMTIIMMMMIFFKGLRNKKRKNMVPSNVFNCFS